ncbi:hypothetical protein RRG08_058495 [Elysia crispata]|uniref:Uncharacterized protein n=1 Tax=Elysia crispata TaxID=231223 RepID=A0AAE0Y7T7_9GAST|nr:hypothetical protein RRG08_058495 [Elysia crispata]
MVGPELSRLVYQESQTDDLTIYSRRCDAVGERSHPTSSPPCLGLEAPGTPTQHVTVFRLARVAPAQ